MSNSLARCFKLAAIVSMLTMLSDTSLANLQERGSITGTVLTAEGKPAVGLNLKLVKDIPRTVGRPGGGKGKSGGFDSGAVGLQGGKGQERTKTIAQVTTDAQGKFTMPNIEVGGYRIEAGNNKIGWIYMDVTVEANKATDVGELKLAKLD